MYKQLIQFTIDWTDMPFKAISYYLKAKLKWVNAISNLEGRWTFDCWFQPRLKKHKVWNISNMCHKVKKWFGWVWRICYGVIMYKPMGRYTIIFLYQNVFILYFAQNTILYFPSIVFRYHFTNKPYDFCMHLLEVLEIYCMYLLKYCLINE